jgi:hypothetical protein
MAAAQEVTLADLSSLGSNSGRRIAQVFVVKLVIGKEIQIDLVIEADLTDPRH